MAPRLPSLAGPSAPFKSPIEYALLQPSPWTTSITPTQPSPIKGEGFNALGRNTFVSPFGTRPYRNTCVIVGA